MYTGQLGDTAVDVLTWIDAQIKKAQDAAASAAAAAQRLEDEAQRVRQAVAGGAVGAKTGYTVPPSGLGPLGWAAIAAAGYFLLRRR